MAEPLMSLEAMVAAINERTRLMLDEQRRSGGTLKFCYSFRNAI